ncbi:concanavalin A-like lectin/glucanases superfamily, partial [Anaerolinea thermolimosa]
MKSFRRQALWLSCFLLGIIGAVFAPVQAQSGGGYALRFYGNGVAGIDRVEISIDNPPVPADIGATDFTLEWWMKALLAENPSTSVSCGSDAGWITGNILFDRDIFGSGDYGDFGVSISSGRVVFGVSQGQSGNTLCGTRTVADGTWHHVAVTRSRANGTLRIFVDGVLDAEGPGPTGDVSYRDGRTGTSSKDPYLVIGAEKHDYDRTQYPSYSGWVDEVRLSTVIRYTGNFSRPVAPFTPDENTAALYHFDEGPAGPCLGVVTDSSGAAGGPSNGQCRNGGTPAGPVYVSDQPFTGGQSTSTPTRTSTPTHTATFTP